MDENDNHEGYRRGQRSRWGLQNFEDVRRQLAGAIRKVQTGKMDARTGSALAAMYRALMDCLQASDYSKRVSELEEMLTRMQQQLTDLNKKGDPVE